MPSLLKPSRPARGWDEWLCKASATQKAFLDSPAKDVVYGGARGGGKSIALLLDFANYAGAYGKLARGAIFRRTYTELEELIYKGQQYFCGQLAWSYNKNEHTFTCTDPSDPACGATLRMAYLKNLDDARVYAGWELNHVSFDELGNWPDPAPLDMLMGSMRSAPGIPTYRRGTCMPGGPGHTWVKQRYRPDLAWEIREYQPMPKEHPELSVQTQFCPALLEDNPNVDQAEYERNLAMIGNAKLYEAWRRGDWSLVAGAFFDCWDEDVHVVFGAPPLYDAWNPQWMAMDWGFRDDCAVGWYGQDELGKVTKRHELKVNGMSPKKVGRLVAQTTVGMGLGKQSLFAVGPDAWSPLKTSPHTIADEIGEGMAEYFEEVGKERDLVPFPSKADTDREGGWMLLYQMLDAGLFVVHESCAETRRSIPAMQHDEKNSADVADSPIDHFPDETRYALKTYFGNQRVPVEEKIRRAIAAKAPELAEKLAAAKAASVDGVEPVVWDKRADQAAARAAVAGGEMTANDWTRYATLMRTEQAKRRPMRHRGLSWRARIGA